MIGMIVLVALKPKHRSHDTNNNNNIPPPPGNEQQQENGPIPRLIRRATMPSADDVDLDDYVIIELAGNPDNIREGLYDQYHFSRPGDDYEHVYSSLLAGLLNG
jgi:hypothetical protein